MLKVPFERAVFWSRELVRFCLPSLQWWSLRIIIHIFSIFVHSFCLMSSILHIASFLHVLGAPVDDLILTVLPLFKGK